MYKLVKFYRGPEGGMHYAVSEDGSVFAFVGRTIESLKWNANMQPVPEDWGTMTSAEWVVLHFPVSLEFHWGDEPLPEEPAATLPHVLTEQEQALDAKYQQDLKWWKRTRNERIGKALDAAVDIDSPFMTRETTEVTTEYSSPLCNKLLAAFIDGDEAPADPITWRREAEASSKMDMAKMIMEAATSFVTLYTAQMSEKATKKPPEARKIP